MLIKPSNIVLALALIPSASLGTFLFYKKGYLKPSVLALIFLTVIGFRFSAVICSFPKPLFLRVADIFALCSIDITLPL